MDWKVVGIDLAGKDKNPTGFCVLTDYGSKTYLYFKNKEILKRIYEQQPDVVAVDAPFDFPKKGYFRPGDQELQKRGFHMLSPKFPGMIPLVERAKKLVAELRKKGFKVIEVYPRASESILGLSMKKGSNEHEYDSLLCALTGKYFLEGKTENLFGIIVPLP